MSNSSLHRRLSGFLHGGSDPRCVALAVGLGLCAGFATGWNLTLALLLLLALVLNVHTRSFLAAWAAGVVGASSLAPVAARLGYILLDGTPLGGWLAGLGHDPLVVLLSLDEYRLCGGLALAMLLAVPLSGTARRWMLRRQLLTLQATRWSRSSGGGDELHLRVRRGPVERSLGWLLFGPVHLAEAATLESDELPMHQAPGHLDGNQDRRPPEVTSPWEVNLPPNEAVLRPLGLLATVPYALAVLGAALLVGPVLLKHGLMHQITQFNRATVDADDFRVSLWDGSFRVRRLALADPQHLTRNRLVLEGVAGQLDVGHLLRGRLHIETAHVERLQFDAARLRPARTVPGRFLPAAPEGALSQVPLTPQRIFETDSWQPIDGYVRPWPFVRSYAAALQKALEAWDALQGWEAYQTPAHATFALLAHPWRTRSRLAQTTPLFYARKIRFEQIDRPLDLGPRGMLEISHLTSRPGKAQADVRVHILAPAARAEVEIALEGGRRDPKHTIFVRAYQLDLPSLVAAPEVAPYLHLTGGTLDLFGQGSFNRRRIDLPLQVEVHRPQATFIGDARLGGLRGSLWQQGLGRIERFRSELQLSGSWHTVRLMVQPAALVQQLKHHLRAAAEHRLVAAIETDLRLAAREPAGDRLARLEAESAPRVSEQVEGGDGAAMIGRASPPDASRSAAQGLAGTPQPDTTAAPMTAAGPYAANASDRAGPSDPAVPSPSGEAPLADSSPATVGPERDPKRDTASSPNATSLRIVERPLPTGPPPRGWAVGYDEPSSPLGVAPEWSWQSTASPAIPGAYQAGGARENRAPASGDHSATARNDASATTIDGGSPGATATDESSSPRVTAIPRRDAASAAGGTPSVDPLPRPERPSSLVGEELQAPRDEPTSGSLSRLWTWPRRIWQRISRREEGPSRIAGRPNVGDKQILPTPPSDRPTLTGRVPLDAPPPGIAPEAEPPSSSLWGPSQTPRLGSRPTSSQGGDAVDGQSPDSQGRKSWFPRFLR